MNNVCRIIGVFLCIESSHMLLYGAMPSILIEEQTFFVYRRYYFIARLEQAVTLIARLYDEISHMQTFFKQQHIDFKVLLPKNECEKIEHHIIRNSITCMYKSCTIKPLFMVWDSFRSYKFLRDELLVEDFSKEVFIIIRNTINQMAKCKQGTLFKHQCMHAQLSTYTLEKMLDDIESMRQYIVNVIQPDYPLYTARLENLEDLKLPTDTDRIAFRFYCLKRVEKAVHFLLAMPPSDILLPTKHAIFHHTEYFYKTFIQLWEDIKQYKHIDNDFFVRDFLNCTLLLLWSKITIYRTSSDENNMTHIYDQITEMPIEELLASIDTILNTLYSINQHYQTSGLTTTMWIKQNWLMVSFLCSAVLFKVLHFYAYKWST